MEAEIQVLDRIRQLCRERNYSYYQLAKRAGIPYSTLNTLLLKGSNPSLVTLQRLCEGLGITLQQFFTEDDAPVSLTSRQEDCLSLFSILSPQEQDMALAYMKGLAKKL